MLDKSLNTASGLNFGRIQTLVSRIIKGNHGCLKLNLTILGCKMDVIVDKIHVA